MVRLPGLSATLRVLSMSLRAFLLRISTLTLELLSIFTYGFFDFFRARTFDFIDCTKFSNWFPISILSLSLSIREPTLALSFWWFGLNGLRLGIYIKETRREFFPGSFLQLKKISLLVQSLLWRHLHLLSSLNAATVIDIFLFFIVFKRTCNSWNVSKKNKM